jgi:hypothetical protein
MKGGGWAGQSIAWEPKRDVRRGPHTRERVPSLLHMTCSLLAEYLDDVETLWGIDDAVRVRFFGPLLALFGIV